MSKLGPIYFSFLSGYVALIFISCSTSNRSYYGDTDSYQPPPTAEDLGCSSKYDPCCPLNPDFQPEDCGYGERDVEPIDE